MVVEDRVRSAVFRFSELFSDKHEIAPGVTWRGAVFAAGTVVSDHVFNAVDKIRGR